MENTAPTYLAGELKRNYLNDASSYLQYGQSVDKDFYNYKLPPPKPSSWVDFPTEEKPNGFFKYASVEIVMS